MQRKGRLHLGLQVAGWVGIWVAAVAFYTATAILTGEVYDHVSSLLRCPNTAELHIFLPHHSIRMPTGANPFYVMLSM